MCHSKTKNNNQYLKVLTLWCLLSLQACNPAKDYSNDKAEVQSQLEKGTPQKTIILLKNVLKVSPQNSHARLALGNIYLDSGNLLLAKKEINSAHKNDPKNLS